MKRALMVFILCMQTSLFAQPFFGDTIWTRDYSSTGAFSCAFSPDGSKLAVAYECMGPMVRVLDVNNGQIIWDSETPDLCLYNLQFSSDGQYIAIAEELGHLLVVDLTIPDTIYNIDTQTGGLTCVDFSPSGDYIYAGGADGTIKIYETSTGTLHHNIPSAHTNGVLTVDVSPSGNLLASGSKDNTIKIWDLNNNYQQIHHFTDHTDDVKSVKFNPVEDRLLSGSVDDKIHVYLLSGGALDTILSIHSADVNTIDISLDGSFAATGSNDQSVKLINLYTYGTIATLTNLLQTRVYGLAISPDMTKLASANHIGYIILYNIQSMIGVEEPIVKNHKVYPNPAIDFIQIEGQQEIQFYQIISVNGKVIQSGNSSGTIDVSSLSAGLYFLKSGYSVSSFIKN